MLTLDAIKAEVDRLAAQIGASEVLLLAYRPGQNLNDPQPHIEVDLHNYHYVVVERGKEIERFTTPELDDLLFTIFASVTFTLALGYERAHRVEGQDSRRILFSRQEDLLAMLSAQWSEREAHHHQEILRNHPYDDVASSRATLSSVYRTQGYAPEIAWQMACERYPLPIR